MRTASRLIALAVAAAVSLTACTGGGGEGAPTDGEDTTAPTAPAPARADYQDPTKPVSVLPGKDATSLALEASQVLFASAPVVMVADAGDEEATMRAASGAVALGAPVLLADGGAASDDDASPDRSALLEELTRLGTAGILTFGDVALPGEADDGSAEGTDDPPASESAESESVDDDVVWVRAPADDATLAELLNRTAETQVDVTPGAEVQTVTDLTRGTFTPVMTEDATSDAADETGAETGSPEDVELPANELADPLAGVLTLTTSAKAGIAATASAIAAGAEPLITRSGDPRATSGSVEVLSDGDYRHVMGIGDTFEDAEILEWRIETARTGVELPGGGQLVFPGKRYVALYGTPSTTALGVLGEQDVPATIDRAAEHAGAYEGLGEDTVVPALEIIATVASSSAGSDGNYSNELPVDSLRPLIEAAHDAGQYVLLDLQPGRTSFVDQAQLYGELLELPNVGLALDPEWNLGPDEVHMVQIGSATAEEVNEVVTWLADFTRERALPQKMLILHQFQVRMIQTVADVDLSRSEIAVLIHADGQGGQPAKQGTWQTLHANAPNIEWWGWKNFYDEDEPMLTPEETAQVEPFPNFISYQ